MHGTFQLLPRPWSFKNINTFSCNQSCEVQNIFCSLQAMNVNMWDFFQLYPKYYFAVFKFVGSFEKNTLDFSVLSSFFLSLQVCGELGTGCNQSLPGLSSLLLHPGKSPSRWRFKISIQVKWTFYVWSSLSFEHPSRSNWINLLFCEVVSLSSRERSKQFLGFFLGDSFDLYHWILTHSHWFPCFVIDNDDMQHLK